MQAHSQGAVFAMTEGDTYWERNRAAIERWDPGGDIPLRLIELYDLKPQFVIEIGAANGYRVAEIQRRYECGHAVATDVSFEALMHGRDHYSDVDFWLGPAHDTGVSGVFDLVIINYVLHWVDRAHLFRTIAEIDRLTASGGYLLLGDFFPSAPMDVPYHHKPGLVTYKRDYAAILTTSGLYQIVALLTSAHGAGLAPDAADNERGCTWLLRKQPGG